MYKVKLWDEDKWNIHSSSYNSSKYSGASPDGKKDDKKYNEQKYGQKEKDVSSDYVRKQGEKEKEDKDKTDVFENLEEEKKENPDAKEDEIAFRAANQIFNERRHLAKKAERRKDVNTIEDAIKKAIEGEKKVIIIDN